MSGVPPGVTGTKSCGEMSSGPVLRCRVWRGRDCRCRRGQALGVSLWERVRACYLLVENCVAAAKVPPGQPLSDTRASGPFPGLTTSCAWPPRNRSKVGWYRTFRAWQAGARLSPLVAAGGGAAGSSSVFCADAGVSVGQ